MPSKNTATNQGTQILFDEITFTQEDIGTYTYKITEKEGDLNGVTYDPAEYTVTVTITDLGNGKLQVTQNGVVPEFKNTFTQGEQDITGTKTWVDGENSNNTRPANGSEDLTLTLYRKSAKAGAEEEIVKGSDGNNLEPTWSGNTYTFADLGAVR